jgi:hypothetical protein
MGFIRMFQFTSCRRDQYGVDDVDHAVAGLYVSYDHLCVIDAHSIAVDRHGDISTLQGLDLLAIGEV